MKLFLPVFAAIMASFVAIAIIVACVFYVDLDVIAFIAVFVALCALYVVMNLDNSYFGNKE